MNTVMTVKKGVVLAMALSAMMLSSAHALTVYTAGPGSLAKSPASGFEQQTGVKVTVFRGHHRQSDGPTGGRAGQPAGGCADLRLVGYRRRSAPAGLVVAFASANADRGTGEPEIGGLYRPRASPPWVLSGTVKAAPRNRKSGGISPSRRLKTR